ncbi:MAG: ATP-binding cassette domain-containing protein [Albidovulum sp.]
MRQRVKAGAVHCLMGDKGAGKSTLLKIMSGIHQPSAGSTERDGALGAGPPP